MPYGNEVGVFVEQKMQQTPPPPEAPDLAAGFIGPLFNIVQDDDDAEAGELDISKLESEEAIEIEEYPSREDEDNPIDEESVEIEFVHRSGFKRSLDEDYITATDEMVIIETEEAMEFFEELNYDWGGGESDWEGLEGSEILIKYRECREDLVGRVILAQGEVDTTQKLGVPSVDNPLGLMGAFAVSVAPNVGHYYIPTRDYLTDIGENIDEGSEIRAALAEAAPKRIYGLTALTNEPDSCQAVTTHVNSMSTPEEKMFRFNWCAIEIPKREDLLETGEEIDDLTKLEVKRRQAEYLANYANSVSDKRTACLFQPFTTSVQGEEVEVPSYYLAGMYNALKASLPPQQGLTRYPVGGVVKELKYADDYFRPSELSEISEGGMFVCEQTQSDAPIYSRGQWTTNMLNNKTKQVSLRYSADDMSYTYIDTLDQLLGVNNVTTGTIKMIKKTTGLIHSTKQSEGTIISAEILETYQDEDNSARVNQKTRCVFPTPLDQIVIVLEY